MLGQIAESLKYYARSNIGNLQGVAFGVTGNISGFYTNESYDNRSELKLYLVHECRQDWGRKAGKKLTETIEVGLLT